MKNPKTYYKYKFKQRKLLKRNISKYNNLVINSSIFINDEISYNYIKFCLKQHKISLNKKIIAELIIFEKSFAITLFNLIFFKNLIKFK